MSDKNFMRYADSSTKAYSLILFFNAKSKASPQIKMPEHFANFKLVSQHVKKAAKGADRGDAANRVFFVALEFDESPRTFMRLGVQSVPWVLHIGPKTRARCEPAFAGSLQAHHSCALRVVRAWRQHAQRSRCMGARALRCLCVNSHCPEHALAMHACVITTAPAHAGKMTSLRWQTRTSWRTR